MYQSNWGMTAFSDKYTRMFRWLKHDCLSYRDIIACSYKFVQVSHVSATKATRV